jgi:hypothetical protein
MACSIILEPFGTGEFFGQLLCFISISYTVNKQCDLITRSVEGSAERVHQSMLVRSTNGLWFCRVDGLAHSRLDPKHWQDASLYSRPRSMKNQSHGKGRSSTKLKLCTNQKTTVTPKTHCIFSFPLWQKMSFFFGFSLATSQKACRKRDLMSFF